MNTLNSIHFSSILKKIQPIHSIEEGVLKEYFSFVFDDILSRLAIHYGRLTKLIFCSYLDLPLIVSDKIFTMFLKRQRETKGLCREDFIGEMYNLYSGSCVVKLQKMIFEIFDYQFHSSINKNDVLLLTKYLITYSENYANLQYEDYVNSLFVSKTSITFEEFINGINQNSDFFVFFLALIYEKQPFGEKELIYFKEVMLDKKIKHKQPEKVTDQLLPFPCKEICYAIGFISKVKRKEANRDLINHINLDEKYKISEKMEEIALFEGKKSSIDHSGNMINISGLSELRSSYSLNEPQILHDQIEAWTISDGGLLIKNQLIKVGFNLFSIRIPEEDSSNSFPQNKLGHIYSLKGYFIAQFENFFISDKTYYSLALINKYGDSNANIRNIFLCENKRERNEFTSKLKFILGIRQIEDYYNILDETDLGKGQFGTVKLGKNILTEEAVAIKILDKTDKSKFSFEMMRRELDILTFLANQRNSHQNIVRVYDIFETTKSIYIVMEYTDKGSLDSIMKNRKHSKEFNWDFIKPITLQICAGLEFLHSNGILHRDIKPHNVLLSKNGKDGCLIKISDFGLSQTLLENETITEQCGTLIFIAPEIFLGKGYNKKVDTWSFGVLLYYMLTGIFPFNSNKETNEIAKNICHQEIKFPAIFKISSELKILFDNILNKDQKIRYDFCRIKHLILSV